MTDELEQLSAELQALGGGTLHVSKYQALVHIAPAPAQTVSIVRRDQGEEGPGQLVVRDPSAPADVPQQQAERRFDLATCIDSKDDRHGNALRAALCEVRSSKEL